MRARPEWLPEITSVAGPFERVIRKLYDIFQRDVVRGSLSLHSLPLWWDQKPTDVFGFTYEEGFRHLVSREYYTPQGKVKRRDFDPARAERLPWFAPTVSNAETEFVLVWDYLEADGKVNTYVWLEEWDYAIVLRKRKQRRGAIYFLLSAHHLDGPARIANLRRKYDRRCN